MTHSTEVNFTVPLLEDLYCINCRVEHSGSFLNSIVKSLFHVQVLYCRLIIYSTRCCIASPSIQNVGDVVHVVVSKRFYATGKLQKHLSDLKIKYSDPEPVHSKVYEACLKYTITFKLAPLWNCIGKSWYLHGDNFLSLPYNNDAVEWEIYYKGQETKLGLKPMTVNLFPFTLENVLPPLLLENFKKTTTLNMNLGFESAQVFVLPKLTKGKVVSVSKALPKSCPFENYDTLRRHWKNMYSYRLPKNAEGIIFCEVVFAINPNKKFTYPEMCLLSSRPEFLASDNKNAVASNFLKDLSECIPRICNEAVKIGRLYPELSVERLGSSIKNIDYPVRIFPYRNIEELSSISKTPADEFVVVRPPEKKLKLSNLFTFKGIDKMTPHMRDHSQKVLSIMNGQNKKMKASSSSQYKSGSSTSCQEKFSNANVRKFSLGNLSMGSKRKTEVSDTDNICSYYEIPSMYPSKSSDFTKDLSHDVAAADEESKEPNPKATNPFTVPSSQPSYPTAKSKAIPTIKNVETVNFDLNGIRKIRTIHEVYKANTVFDESKNMKTKRKKENEVISPFFDKEKYDKEASSNNSLNNVQKESLSKNAENYCKMGEDNQFKEAEDVNSVLKENKAPSGKEDLRSLFSKFDSYNMGEEEDQQFENNIYSECNNTPFAFVRGDTKQEKLSYHKFNNQLSENNSLSPLSLSPIQTSPSLLRKYHSPEVSPKNCRQSLDKTQFLEPTMDVTMEKWSNTLCPSPLSFEVNSRDENHGRQVTSNRSLFCEADVKESQKRESRSFYNFSKREESFLDQSIPSNYTLELCGDSLVRKYSQSKKLSISQASQVTVKNPQGPSENNFFDESEFRRSPSILDMCNLPTQKLDQMSIQQNAVCQASRQEEPSLSNNASDSRKNFESSINSTLDRTLDTCDRFEFHRKSSPFFQFGEVKHDDRVFKLDELGPNNPACDNSDFLSIVSQSTDSEPESSVYEHLKQEYEEALTYYD